MLKTHFKFIRTEGLTFEIVTLHIGLVLTVFSIYGIAIFSDVPKSEDAEYIASVVIGIILTGATLSVLASLIVHLKTKGKRFMKFINDTTI